MRIITITTLLILASIESYAQVGYTQEGTASFYAEKFEGRTTASGESYSFRKATCAHLNLPFGTIVKVTNLANNQSVIVRVNDRGPFVPDRIIDISRSAAEKLGFANSGTAKVKLEVVEASSQIIANKNSTPIQIASTPTSSQKVIENNQLAQPENELYDLQVNLVQPKGFTIQIGSYKEMVNIFRIANDLKNSLKKEIRIQVTSVNNEKIYRLFVGNFTTRKEAEGFKEKAIKIYPDCFIIELK